MSKKQKFSAFLWLSACLLLINFIASEIRLQWDFTDDSFYTLSEESKKIIDQVDKPIQLEFYFSEHIDTLPIGFKNFATRIRQLLTQYAKHSSDKISLKIIDPMPGSREQSEAERLGIYSQRTENGDALYFGLAAIQGANTSLIPLFDYRRESILDYDISKSIYAVQQQEKPVLGILSSLPVFGDPEVPPESRSDLDGTSEWQIIQELRDLYTVNEVSFNSSSIPENIDLLLLIQPVEINQKLEESILQFIDSEKPAVLLLDPYNYGEAVRDMEDGMVIGATYNITGNLPSLLNKWKIEFNPGQVVADFDNPTEVPPYEGASPVEYPLWISLTDFDDEMVITSGFDQIMLANPGFIQPLKSQTIQFTSLIKSSKHSGLVGIDQLESLGLLNLRDEIAITDKNYTFAALLEGHPENPNIHAHFVIISDSDFISNGQAYQGYERDGQVITRPRNNNTALVINSLDYLNGSQSLLSLRGKGQTIRPFTRIHQIKQQAENKVQDEIVEINQKLSEIGKRMDEMQQNYKSSSNSGIDQVLILELQKMNKLESRFRQQKREISKRADLYIRELNRNLSLINLVPIPVIISLCGIIFISRRSKRRKIPSVK